MKAPVLLIDLGSVYWAAWHSSANDEVSAAHDRAVAQTRRLLSGFDLVAVCCDSPTNFRKDLEPSYKANRPARDSAAYEQLRRVKDTLARDGLLLWEATGFEADDVLATACRAAVKAGHEVVVASSDKDLTQVVEMGVTWLSPKTGERLDRDGVRIKFGVWPEQMRDFLAICGDSSDNVRGVAGVGPKGATKLLTEYATIEQLIAAVQEDPAKVATPKIAAAIAEASAWLPTSIKLVTLRYDVPITWEQIYERREVRPLSNESTDMSDDDQENEASEENQEQAPAEERKPEPATQQIAPVRDMQIARMPQQDHALVAPPSWDMGLEPTSLGAAFKLAVGLYNSRLYSRFPSAEAIWAVIIRGREMGMGALTSLDSFHIVEGKPSPSAHLLIARAKAHPDCEYIEYVGGDDTYAEWEGKTRRGKPVTLRYTIEQAKRAGMVKGGGNWEKRPGEMLRKTAGVQLCRILVPGAMQGLYAVEEMGAA